MKKIVAKLRDAIRRRIVSWKVKRSNAAFDRRSFEALIECRRHAANLWGKNGFMECTRRDDLANRVFLKDVTYPDRQPPYAIVRVELDGGSFCIGAYVVESWPNYVYSVTQTSADTRAELTFTSKAPSDDLGSQVFYEQVFWRWVTTRDDHAEKILIAWHKLAEYRQTLERLTRGSIEEPA